MAESVPAAGTRNRVRCVVSAPGALFHAARVGVPGSLTPPQGCQNGGATRPRPEGHRAAWLVVRDWLGQVYWIAFPFAPEGKSADDWGNGVATRYSALRIAVCKSSGSAALSFP